MELYFYNHSLLLSQVLPGAKAIQHTDTHTHTLTRMSELMVKINTMQSETKRTGVNALIVEKQKMTQGVFRRPSCSIYMMPVYTQII